MTMSTGNGGTGGRWRWATRLGLAWLLVVVLAGAGWFGWHWWRGGGRLYHFEPGQQLTYEVVYQNEGTSDFTAPFRDPDKEEAPPKQRVKTLIKTRLILTVLSCDDDSVSLA